MTVVAVVTDRTETLAAAQAALEEALATRAELTVIGVVTPRFQPPQSATGERIRQRRLVTAVVDSALELARESGLDADGAIASGTTREAGLREAIARAAATLFVPRTSSRLGRRAKRSVERIAVVSERHHAVAELAA